MMSAPTTQRSLNRRGFLRLAAMAGVTSVGGYLLFEYAPWLDIEQVAQHTRRALEPDQAGSVRLRQLVRYATLAANGHNAQAWKFAIRENTIEIHPDYSRRLPVVDPEDRELWMSLGCALENLLVAARATGYDAEVVYPDGEDVIRVRLAENTPQSSTLFDAIPRRQSTRSDYDGQPVATNFLDQLIALPPGEDLHL
ncbi:MAG: hypothetical protein IPK19_05470 [Chloroflexi bacterium]|nr:hypothetical protein [Chloroflexota bacterium]